MCYVRITSYIKNVLTNISCGPNEVANNQTTSYSV